MSKQWPQGAEEGEVVRGNDEFGLYKPDDTPAVVDGSLNKFKTAEDVKTFMKGTIKVLWTGPLSVISTPTSLNGDEKFSDWDLIQVDFNVESDLSTFNRVPYVLNRYSTTGSYRVFGPTGSMDITFLSDTSFRITAKTLSAGNITEIRGISL